MDVILRDKANAISEVLDPKPITNFANILLLIFDDFQLTGRGAMQGTSKKKIAKNRLSNDNKVTTQQTNSQRLGFHQTRMAPKQPYRSHRESINVSTRSATTLQQGILRKPK